MDQRRRRLATRIAGWRKAIGGLHTVACGFVRAGGNNAAARAPPYPAKPETLSRSFLAAISGSSNFPETLILYPRLIGNAAWCFGGGLSRVSALRWSGGRQKWDDLENEGFAMNTSIPQPDPL